MAATNLRDVIHPSVLYERIELHESDNALAAWQRACATLTNNDELSALASIGDECDCYEEHCLACHPPGPTELKSRCDRLLVDNAQALRHFDDALSVGRLQVRIAPPDFEGGAPLSESRDLVRLVRIQARGMIEDGDLAAAARSFSKISKAGGMLANCDGTVVQFLVALAIEGMAVHDLTKLAERSDSSPEVVKEIAGSVDELIGPASAARVLQSEFCHWSLPAIESVAGLVGDSALEGVVDLLFPDVPNAEPPHEPVWDVRGWTLGCRRQIRQALQGHPQLWDACETLRALSLEFADDIADFLEDSSLLASIATELESWRKRSEAFDAIWPSQFGSLGCFVAMDPDFKPLTKRAQTKLRARLLPLANPLGLLMTSLLQSCLSPDNPIDPATAGDPSPLDAGVGSKAARLNLGQFAVPRRDIGKLPTTSWRAALLHVRIPAAHHRE